MSSISRRPPATVGAGPPVLDIGGDIGALVATMDDGTAGTELFLRPDHDPTTTVHTGVWERLRRPADGARCSRRSWRGRTTCSTSAAPVRTVDVDGGRVSTIDLRH